jgi:sarcosine oxidase gamma subunit
MKQQTVKSLLRTLKQIEKERKKRTTDLEEAAKLVLKHLADLGHVGIKAVSPKQWTAVKKAGKRNRVRRKFAVSGEQSILNFVKSKSNPIGKEIQKHWASEGRAGAAANLISCSLNH